MSNDGDVVYRLNKIPDWKARAEKAEAERDRLREALTAIAASKYASEYPVPWAQNIARAALAQNFRARRG